VVDILDSRRVPVNNEERKHRIGHIPYYGATGQVGWIDSHLFDEELVLLGEDGAPFLDSTKPKAYLVRGKSWVNNHAHVLRAKAGLLNSFLLYQLNCIDYRPYVSGTTRLKLPQGPMKQIPLLVPEEDEQREIVAEIEKQFTRLEAGVAGLRRAQANLKRYRAAVLKAACEGKLVPTEACLRQAERGRQAELARQEGCTLPAPRPGVFFVYAIRCDNDSIYIGQTQDLQKRWQEHLAGQAADWTCQHKPRLIVHFEEYSSREEAVAREKWLKTGFGRKWLRREIAAGRARQAGYETGAQLLERILAERRKPYESAQSSGNRKKKYNEPRPPTIATDQELPKGWTWASWDQIAFSQNGRPFPSAEYVAKGFKLLRPGNLHVSGKVVWTEDNTRCMPQRFAEENPDLIVRERELVMNLTAQSLKDEFLGRVCLTSDGEECLLNQRLARLTTVVVPPEFALYLLRAWRFRRFVDGLNSGSLIQHMFTSQLEEFTFPLPPLAEQQRIVAEVERCLSVVDELEAVVKANLQRGIRLRQSILQRAFEGKSAPRYD
jgi:type I restriction enzyme S subunit